MPELQDKASLLRNACKPQDFDLPADRISKPLSGRPKVGYAGSLDHWIDFELLKNVTAMLPEMDFVFAGRIEDERIQQLRGPNVNLLGEIPYVAVPKMLHECDAAIIPFARVPLTMATNPIKLYEYFCAGLPVVSTRLPEIEEFSDLVYVSDTAEEFASALRRAVAEQDRSFRTLRLATGRLESWERRAAALLERLSACGLSDELTDPVEDVGLEGSSPFSEGEKLRGILNVRT